MSRSCCLLYRTRVVYAYWRGGWLMFLPHPHSIARLAVLVQCACLYGPGRRVLRLPSLSSSSSSIGVRVIVDLNEAGTASRIERPILCHRYIDILKRGPKAATTYIDNSQVRRREPRSRNTRKPTHRPHPAATRYPSATPGTPAQTRHARRPPPWSCSRSATYPTPQTGTSGPSRPRRTGCSPRRG